MKTSIQHIIEYLEQNDLNQDTLHFAKLMLDKEKQDLIDAYNQGVKNALVYDYEGKDYFNQTFKQ